MIVNTARQRMLAGRPALGGLAVLGMATGAGILARAGFDFVLLDYQHGEWDDAAALAACRAIALHGATPMARVRQNDFYAIGRALDRGALGIIVPMVNSAAEAQAAAFAMRYPPYGGRSYGAPLALHYGADYDAWADQEVMLIVQIETAQAAAHADEILRVEGVDGCWIGPNDLARSLGVPMRGPAHAEAIQGVLAACRRTRKIPGIYTADGAEARRWLAAGFQFVTVGSDTAFLADGAAAALAATAPAMQPPAG